MNDSFVPKNMREGHPYIRGLINYLISLFRAWALVVVLEYSLYGKVEKQHRRIFQEFYRAEEEVPHYDPVVWSLRKTELLVSMGMLLGPYLFDDDYKGN
jgi:hypothetical protein